MRLVHVRLNGTNVPIGPDFPSFLMSCAVEGDRLEYATVHEGPSPTLGLFLSAESVEQAERAAHAVVRRALGRRPELAHVEVVSARTPLVTAFYERLLTTSLP
ncbi:hypothetical protein ACFT5C_35055, partial [Streptomyces sp. NPDC057116]